MLNSDLKIDMTLDLLHISIADQQLYGFSQGKLHITMPVSTAINGVGEVENSHCTPRGKHQIRAKIGANLPINAVLRGRRWTKEIWSTELSQQHPNRDWILTRILWLSGCELGFNRLGNVDSFRRYIYLHGTPDTEPMGIAQSHGCIRLRNTDIIKLFDLTPLHCSVQISEHPYTE